MPTLTVFIQPKAFTRTLMLYLSRLLTQLNNNVTIVQRLLPVLIAVSMTASVANAFNWPENKTINSTHSASLVELFTSQGCSSCPPAERYLNTFKDKESLWRYVVPVAFHVDYWDHLGWKDKYAKALYSNRQRAYRKNNNIKSVYTPGFVVNGKEWRGYYFGKDLPQQANDSTLTLKLTPTHVHATWKSPSSHTLKQTDVTLHMAILGVGIKTPIKRGENNRRTLEQDFTVLQHTQHASQNGEWTIAPNINNIQPSPRYAVAFWVQHNHTLDVLHATGSWL